MPTGNQVIARGVTTDETLIACGTNYYHPNCEYRLVSLQHFGCMGVATDHVISLQLSDLSLVKRYVSTGFCPETVDVPTAFVEYSEFA